MTSLFKGLSMRLFFARIAVALLGLPTLGWAAYPIENTPPEVLCQEAFKKSEFRQLDEAYSLYLANTVQPGKSEKSVECVESIQVMPIADTSWKDVDLKTQAWMQVNPNSALARIVRAKALTDYAQLLDGQNAEWKVVDAYLAKALALLEEGQSQSRKDPNWHVRKLVIARVQGWPSGLTVDLISDAAANASTSFSPYAEAVHTLGAEDPWGSPELVEWTARLALSRTQSTWGSGMYARIYAEAAVWFYSLRINPFGRGAADWKTLGKGFADLAKLYPRNAAGNFPVEYSIDLHAHFACLAKDRRLMRSLLAQIGNNVNRAQWFLGPGPNWAQGGDYDRCKAWADKGEGTS
ncbi:MAG: hypothetical protein KIS62_06865 [Ramlibacter sp.]|nr:hypothetical protein [Ramlibacter sp.]